MYIICENYILLILYQLYTLLISVCRGRTKLSNPGHAKPVGAETRDNESETEGETLYASPAKGSFDKGSAEQYNSKGMRVNINNVP